MINEAYFLLSPQHLHIHNAIVDIPGRPRIFYLIVSVWDAIIEVAGRPRIFDLIIGVRSTVI